MSATETESPEFYRKRYFELKAEAERARARLAPAQIGKNPETIPTSELILEETVPPFWYWTRRIPRGQTIRIVNDAATQGVSVFLWNADDPTERYNTPDSVKVQWTARLTSGKLMLSDMGRVLASITADTCGLHDSVTGGSTAESNLRKYGTTSMRNTRDNFLLCAAKYGLGARDVGACTTFFAAVVTDGSGHFTWQEGSPKTGDYVDLRAEMNLIFALSNCPHPLSRGGPDLAKPVRVLLWRSPAAGPNDFCRNAASEASRAFENTDALFAS
jgi:urea carboxylase-associated protein 2